MQNDPGHNWMLAIIAAFIVALVVAEWLNPDWRPKNPIPFNPGEPCTAECLLKYGRPAEPQR